MRSVKRSMVKDELQIKEHARLNCTLAAWLSVYESRPLEHGAGGQHRKLSGDNEGRAADGIERAYVGQSHRRALQIRCGNVSGAHFFSQLMNAPRKLYERQRVGVFHDR